MKVFCDHLITGDPVQYNSHPTQGDLPMTRSHYVPDPYICSFHNMSSPKNQYNMVNKFQQLSSPFQANVQNSPSADWNIPIRHCPMQQQSMWGDFGIYPSMGMISILIVKYINHTILSESCVHLVRTSVPSLCVTLSFRTCSYQNK